MNWMDYEKTQELEALLVQIQSNLTNLGKKRIEELKEEIEQNE
jgi:hypothetical protein